MLIADMFSLIAVVPLAVPHRPASTQDTPCSAMPLQTRPGGGTGAPACGSNHGERERDNGRQSFDFRGSRQRCTAHICVS
jgi:hypothetical protein